MCDVEYYATSNVTGMARRVDVDDLVGTAEIAERLGAAHPELIHDWRRRYPDFPAPVARLRIGFIWSWPDIAKWARATGRGGRI
jgi:hypothetical protein